MPRQGNCDNPAQRLARRVPTQLPPRLSTPGDAARNIDQVVVGVLAGWVGMTGHPPNSDKIIDQIAYHWYKTALSSPLSS
jgi:hypothetical protein